MTGSENNLTALFNRYPELKNRKELFQKQSESPFHFARGKRGYLFLTYRNTRLCSSYDPVKEAARLFSGFSANDSSRYILPSAGLGYEIREFRKRYPNQHLDVIEFNGFFFSELINHTDLADLFSDALIQWHLPFLCRNSGELSRFSESLGVRTVMVPMNDSWKNLETQTSREFFTALQNTSNRYLSNRLTLRNQERLWNRNYIENLIHCEHCSSLSVWKDRLRGRDCLILAAGPSLESSLEFIRANRERLFIICVDTSLRFCFQNDFLPDMAVAGDSQFYNSRHFTGLSEEFFSTVDLVCNLTVHPSVLRQKWRGLYLYRSTVPFSKPFHDLELLLPPLPSGGSVTTTALSLAVFLRTSAIIIAGLDLAVSRNRSHYRGSYPEETGRATQERTNSREKAAFLISEGDTIRVNGRNSRTVVTDKRLFFYKNWVEQFIARSDITVTDICGEGIEIAGLHPPDSLESVKGEKFNRPGPLSSIKIGADLLTAPAEEMLARLSSPGSDEEEIPDWLPGMEDRNSEEKEEYSASMQKKLERLKKVVKSR